MTSRPALAALGFAALALLSAPAAAQEFGPGDPDAGARLYMDHCAMCHGTSAEGDGPMAAVLTVKPPDLTRLSARNGGTFPLPRVAWTVDGRDPLLAHGGPMPLFGNFFQGEDVALKTAAGQPLITSRPIADLAAWLAGVQR